MAQAPRLSVVLAVWNGEAYLAESLRSIVAQTFHDWELIVVDDGSTDHTAQILDQFQQEDARIRVYSQPNCGLIASLNRGLTIATGEYVARMDADDVSMPDRFAVQVEYMDQHQDIGICGSWIETFEPGTSEVVKYPSDDGAIRCQLIFSSALAHPTVMLRRSVLVQYSLRYHEQAKYAEDYDLWVRAAVYTRLANIPAVLLRYRVHPQQVDRRFAGKMEASSQTIRLSQLTRLGISPTPEEARLHHNLSGWQFESSASFLSTTREWFEKLVGANALTKIYPEEEFLAVLGQRWSNVCLLATRSGWQTLIEFWRAPRLALSVWGPRQHLKFAVRCLFRKDPYTKVLGIYRATS